MLTAQFKRLEVLDLTEENKTWSTLIRPRVQLKSLY